MSAAGSYPKVYTGAGSYPKYKGTAAGSYLINKAIIRVFIYNKGLYI